MRDDRPCSGGGTRTGVPPLGRAVNPDGAPRRTMDLEVRGLRNGRGFALMWLVYLIYPLVSLFRPHLEPLHRLAGFVGLALFVADYAWAWSGDVWIDRRTPVAAALAFVLAVALSALLGPDFAGLFIFVAALSARLPSFAISVAVAVVDTAACVVALLLLQVGVGNALALGGFCGLTGLVSLGTRRLASTAGALRAAREEIARLATVEERLRISRDVHDLLGHSLAVIALKAELAGRLVHTDLDRVAAEIADVQAVARRSLAEVREAVAGYRRLRLDEELARARAGLYAAGIRCAYTQGAGHIPEAPDSVLAWVVREAATNVLKHSRARTCQIQITRRQDRVAALVEDDGVGPRPAGAGPQPGSGLAGLKERVRVAGGDLHTGQAALGGFLLEAWVPLDVPTPHPAPEGAGDPLPLGVPKHGSN